MSLAVFAAALRVAAPFLVPFVFVCCGGSTRATTDAATQFDSSSNDQSAESVLNEHRPTSDGPAQGDAQPDAIVDAPADAALDVPVVTPTITGLSPASLSIGSPDLYFTLLVYGHDLPDQAWVVFDGNLFTAQFVSTMQLQVSIPTIALGTRPRMAPVMVERKVPPDLSSNTLYFEVTAMDAGQGN